MHALFSMLAGAGAMYLLDPEQGGTRRAKLRDKWVALTNDLQDAADVISRDASNRMEGLRSGDMSVLVGGKNALSNPFRGGWSPTGRAILGGLGSGLFLYGLALRSPKACLLGTAGLAMIAEGVTNAGIDDVRRLPQMFSGDDESADAESSISAKRDNELQMSTEPREFSR
jgi:hypothetical protein